MKQFMPHDGIYAFARQKDGKTILTVLNGTTKAATFDIRRYAEVIGDTKQGTDILTGKTIDLTGKTLKMKARESLIIEL